MKPAKSIYAIKVRKRTRFGLPRANEAFHFRGVVLAPSFAPFWGKAVMDLASRTSNKKVQLEALRRQESKQRIADIKKQQEEECVFVLAVLPRRQRVNACLFVLCVLAVKPSTSRSLLPRVLAMNPLHCINLLWAHLIRSILTWYAWAFACGCPL